ncbi:unnamed protein product [Boreogadus saida]
MEGQVAAPHPKGLEAANLEGLETAEVLEATAGLEVEANLEVLESVGLEAAVGSNLEGLEAVGSNLECLEAASWSAWRRRPGVPGGGVLECPAAASWSARRRRPGGPGGGVLEGPAAAPHPEVQAVGPVEVLEEMVPAVEDGWGIRRWRIEGVTGDEVHCSGADDPPPPTHLSREASSWCRRSNLHLFEETKQLND